MFVPYTITITNIDIIRNEWANYYFNLLAFKVSSDVILTSDVISPGDMAVKVF